MKKVLAVAALMALAACAKKTPTPAADTTTAAPAPAAPADTAAHDSTMPRDTAHQM
jgi:type IV pilus biogenesis protein CpaD/CtpE